MEYPKFEKVDETTIRIIQEKAEEVRLVQQSAVQRPERERQGCCKRKNCKAV